MSTNPAADALARHLFGMTPGEAHQRRVCIRCRRSVRDLPDVDAREYGISALCRRCFDAVTPDDEREHAVLLAAEVSR